MRKNPPGAVQECPCRDHWIEIQLQDDDGQPVPNEAYVLVDSEGKEHKGNLDSRGFMRLDGLKPGTCSVSFPKLYKKWKPVLTSNSPIAGKSR